MRICKFNSTKIVSGTNWEDTYWSDNSATASRLTDEPIPSAPPNFAGVSNGITKITLSWNQPSGWHSGCYYRIYRDSTRIVSSTTLRYYTHTPPSPTTTYTYKVYAMNSKGQYNGYSTWSGKVTGGGGGIIMSEQPNNPLVSVNSFDEPMTPNNTFSDTAKIIILSLLSIFINLELNRLRAQLLKRKKVFIHG